MSLELMRARINKTGRTPREELVRDAQNIYDEELENDISYDPDMYIFEYDENGGYDSRPAHIRVYHRMYSTLHGAYQSFSTSRDNPIKVGDYFHNTREGTHWMVQQVFNVDDVYISGVMIQCNYVLKWETADGTIVERWANIVSASKYNMGLDQNDYIAIVTNSYTIMIGYCEEGFELEGMRVFIDKRTDNPTKVFQLTRNDDILFDAEGNGAILNFIADRVEFNATTDRPDLGICDYHEPSVKEHHRMGADTDEPVIRAIISGAHALHCGMSREWTVSFIDDRDNPIEDYEFTWNVVGDYEVEMEPEGNSVWLYVDDESLIGGEFDLRVMNNENEVMAQTHISIQDMF